MTPALIKRVESATGEDRHLDAYIFAAFHREPIEPAKSWSVLDSFQFRFTDGRKNALYVHEDDVPAYCSSLDAAVSLCDRIVKPHYPSYTRRHDIRVDSRGQYSFIEITVPSHEFQGRHTIEPMALVIAVLTFAGNLP